MEEILKGKTPQLRAVTIVHFIRLCMALQRLKNIHALFAVVSGLQSVSIYRLSKTWACLPKNCTNIFKSISELFDETCNWSTLRTYMVNVKLPCIPFLGMFLTDLIHWDSSDHPESIRTERKREIISQLFRFKTCKYPLKNIPKIKEYLASTHYIEELQKFHEDTQYK